MSSRVHLATFVERNAQKNAPNHPTKSYEKSFTSNVRAGTKDLDLMMLVANASPDLSPARDTFGNHPSLDPHWRLCAMT
jgi:hypothetical protein